jgi:PAS domain S-box-containing protein
MNIKSLSILIIEDSESDANLIVRHFEQAGYHITFGRVETADQMEAALKKQSWDLVIADYNLPEFNAPSALAVFQKAGLDIPFIVVSGTIGEETAVEIMKAGANDYVMKKSLARLVPAVERELGEAQIRRARIQSEEKIKQAAEEWMTTFNSITDMVSIHDTGFRCLRANKAYSHSVGMTQDELMGRHCYEVMHGTEFPILDCPHKQALETGKLAVREIYEPHMGMYFEISASPIFDGKGVVVGSVHIAKNITARKRSEEALQASEENFRRSLDESPLGIRIVSKEGETLYVNHATLDIFGYDSLEEWQATRAVKRYTEQSYAEFEVRREKRRLGGDGSSEYGINIIKKGGAVRHIHVWRKKVLWNGKEHYQVIYRDITERKRVEKQLQDTLESLRKAVSATIQLMVSAVETRDPYTSGHQIRTADLARAIAMEMGLSQDKIDAIRMAGSIHDIGKLSIPAEILSKPTKLSEIEFSLIKEHARQGFELLKGVESPWPLAEIVYQHHERMDGSGYPRNLRGDDILIEARILMVADVVEAMASHSPYRPGLGIDLALQEIEKNGGIFYDKVASDACLRLFRVKGFYLEGT